MMPATLTSALPRAYNHTELTIRGDKLKNFLISLTTREPFTKMTGNVFENNIDTIGFHY